MKEPELENYHVHCYLRELMAKRDLSVDQLHQMSGTSCDTISKLRTNSFEGVSKQNIARICGSLSIPIEKLFVVLPKDIWLPIRLSKKATVHFGSRVLSEVRPGSDGQSDRVLRPYLGVWDFRAFQKIQAYLASLAPDILVDFREHITGEGGGVDPNTRSLAQQIFEGGGNHILIGSPIANRFVEEVVCHAFGVEPYNPNHHDAFPYGFAWDESRHRRSSLGWRASGNVYGIAARPSETIVAPCNIVRQGEGTDGALIVVYRAPKDPKQPDGGHDQERIIICFLGYSGPGTDAAAWLATNPEFAAGLYPAVPNQPRMRALSCGFHRQGTGLPFDQLDETGVQLIPEAMPGHASKTERSSEARPPAGPRRRPSKRRKRSK